MSLLLDPRRRAMLREMGVRVWQPAPSARPRDAIDSIANDAQPQRAKAQNDLEPPVHAVVRVTAPVAASAAPLPRAAAAPASGWRVAASRTLYPPQAGATTRWLVLVETPAASLRDEGFDPLAGEAGELLDKMLRAARLPQAALALLVPVARLSATAPHDPALAETLARQIAEARPDVVLIMGRLAAQAVLQTSDPLGKLRGCVHSLAALHSVPIVVTYEAAYLLRNPGDKGRAWDDLKLAMASGRNLSAS